MCSFSIEKTILSFWMETLTKRKIIPLLEWIIFFFNQLFLFFEIETFFSAEVWGFTDIEHKNRLLKEMAMALKIQYVKYITWTCIMFDLV